jgi:hypothetical protein
MAAVTLAGTTWDTNAGNKTVVATPAVGDLIIVIAPATGVATSVVTDNQTPAGVYNKINANFTGFSTAGDLSAWVRTAYITAASSTTWTVTQTSSTGGGLCVLRISGMSTAGIGAIRGCGGQTAGTLGTTPAPVLLRRSANVYSGTQAALTTNVIIGAVCNGTNGATTVTPPASYTEHFDNGYNVPATGFEVCSINSGITASTITFGSTTATAFASIAIELECSVPQYDWVVTGKADRDREIWIQSATGVRATR